MDHSSATQNTITKVVYVKYCFDKEKRAAVQAWSDHLQKVLAVPKKSNVSSMIVGLEPWDHFFFYELLLLYKCFVQLVSLERIANIVEKRPFFRHEQTLPIY